MAKFLYENFIPIQKPNYDIDKKKINYFDYYFCTDDVVQLPKQPVEG